MAIRFTWWIKLLSFVYCIALNLDVKSQNFDSTKNGKYQFYQNSKLLWKGQFKGQKRIGIFTNYNLENGQIFSKVKYRNGIIIWTVYYKDNMPYEKSNKKGVRRKLKPCNCGREV